MQPPPVAAAAASPAPAEPSWLDLAVAHERDRPNDPWLVQPGAGAPRVRTWAEGVGEARRIAAHLGHLPRGSAVAILGQNSPEFVLMDLAIWMAGHVSVPLYPTMPAESVRYVLDHCEARAIFLGKLADPPPVEALPPGLRGLALERSPGLDFPRWEDVVAGTEPLQGELARDADELATVMYTSGTTGRPKGVEHTFRSMRAAGRALAELTRLGPDSRFFSYLPLAHTAERLGVEGMAFETGGRITFNQSLATLGADLALARPTLFGGVPRVWMKLRDRVLAAMPERRLSRLLATPILGRLVRRKVLGQLGFDGLRLAVVGAAPCPPEVLEFWRRLGVEMIELYGMTENFGYCHLTRPGSPLSGRIGPPVPGAEARIAESGELEMRSPGLMRGYHREPEATRVAFTADGFLRTGDRGDIDAAGNLRITGRTKEIFKTSKGKYVSPAEIENALLATGLLDLACVMGVGEPQPFAVATVAETTRARAAESPSTVLAELSALLDSVNASRPPHERLSRLVLSRDAWTPESALVTPTLKLRRGPLEERYAARLSAAPPGVSWLEGSA